MAKNKEVEEVEEVVKSQAVKDFEALIERYKIQNPLKYEIKKAELEKQLVALSAK